MLLDGCVLFAVIAVCCCCCFFFVVVVSVAEDGAAAAAACAGALENNWFWGFRDGKTARRRISDFEKGVGVWE